MRMGRGMGAHLWLVLGVAAMCVTSAHGTSTNISCYQCTEYTNKECGPEFVLPCPSQSDRCVTHIMKDKKQGFVLKRECGLGPCEFDDEILNRHLGLNMCDRTKDEFFCVTCCRENACNRNSARRLALSHTWTIVLLLIGCFLSYTSLTMRDEESSFLKWLH